MELRQQFKNQSEGVVGAVKIHGPAKEPKGVPVAPGASVWLSRDEQILTAQAPADPANNPFTDGSLVAQDEPREIPADRWIPADGPQPTAEETPVQEPQEPAQEEQTGDEQPAAPVEEEITGTTPAPAGDGAIGVQAEQEIVGRPPAPSAPVPPAPPKHAPTPVTK